MIWAITGCVPRNIPYMTPRGTFVINGAERVVVSQLLVLRVYSLASHTLTEQKSILPV
jgi:DNA-directed RNA polymerase beta subunit